MASEFAEYSPEVPMGVTWEEQMLFLDEDGNPVDLTGYTKAHEQLRTEKFPVLDADGNATTAPVLEITTVDAYSPAPSWPVAEGFTLGGAAGTITKKVNVADLRRASPTNAKLKTYAELVLIGADDYRIPIVKGCPILLPAVTLIKPPTP
jgi:hypothetical protein